MFKRKPNCVSKLQVLSRTFLYRKPMLSANMYSSGFCIYLQLYLPVFTWRNPF